MKYKIAVIGLKGLPAFGGAASVGENLIDQLKDQYDFTVYATSSHTDLNTGFYNGYKQIVFRSIPFRKLNTLYYYLLSALHSIFFSRFDLVHLHHRDAAFIIILLKIRYRVILTTHGAFNLVEKWKSFKFYFDIQTKLFCRFADIVTCVSKNEQRKFKSILNINSIYIPNGINSINSLTVDKPQFTDYIFFAAGRIVRSKGCDIFLKALKQINYKEKIVIAGHLEQSFEIKNEMKILSEGLDVLYTGLIKEKKKLLGLLANAKLFVFPSNLEAMSMMLLEAISMHVPIICSDIVENKDILNEDEVLFFRTDDITDLSEKILFAINNIEIMQSFAQKAFNRILNDYNWVKIAQKYKNVYDSLLN